MIDIDCFAYSNKIRHVHPMEKFIFAIGTMVICLIANSIPVNLIALGMMFAATVGWARIPVKVYLKLLSLPLGFILLGIVTVIVSFSYYGDLGYNMLYSAKVGAIAFGIKGQDLLLGITIFSKSMATVSCLYFLSLSTPMVELIAVLRRLKVPMIMIDLMGLIYRFIFVLLETADKIKISQSSRLGYKNFKTSIDSLSQLTSNMFVKSMHKSNMLYTALTARGYTGDLSVLEPEYVLSKRNIAIILVIEAALICWALKFGGSYYG